MAFFQKFEQNLMQKYFLIHRRLPLGSGIRKLSNFVPKSGRKLDEKALGEFQTHFRCIDRLVVLTGAGISTESGIPDYRSKLKGHYKLHQPITHQEAFTQVCLGFNYEFMSSEWWRRRYWARNFLAWPRFGETQCNETHRTLARWEQEDANSNRFKWLITQNVDGLHAKAGSRRVSELHGCGHSVRCMDCGAKYDRSLVQSWMLEQNAEWVAGGVGELGPDGDVDIAEQSLHTFRIPHCISCGTNSVLKTDVVFFGDNVPLRSVQHCSEMIGQCSGLLVLGSSLAVLSGFRFVAQAHMLDIPILIVNIGETRADPMATIKLEAKCTDVITRLEWQSKDN